MKAKLSSLQIKILRLLSAGEYKALKELASALKKSQSRISVALKGLEDLGFVATEKTGLAKKISLASNKHAVVFKTLLSKHPNLKIEKYLSGSVIEVLLPIVDTRCSVSDIGKYSNYSERTVLRVVSRLQEIGAVLRENGLYSINPQFDLWKEFIKEFQAYLNAKLTYNISKSATLLWQSGKEFLIETKDYIKRENFHVTGYEKLGEFGVPLILKDVRHYFHTPYKNKIKIEDVCLHTLVLDPTSTRNILYVLLAVAKNQKKINWNYLRKESVKYNLKALPAELKEYLETKGRVKQKYFPTWPEFKEKAREYDIDV